MDRLKRINSYAIRTKDYAIRFRTDQPDYSSQPDQDFDWTYSVYGDVQEILPDDMPEPLGNAVDTNTTIDANLNDCLGTGNSLTGCLHLVNKTLVDWYSKKQATVETARICCCQNCNRADHGHQADLEVPWGTNWLKILSIW